MTKQNALNAREAKGVAEQARGSAEKGVEETPVWALSGAFEQHISACVAIAAWNYYRVTQDKDWLREKGWAAAIHKHLRYGGKVVGLCGGYQMLGRMIHDPRGRVVYVGLNQKF